ncbi:MAG TPA: DUF1893 domain-containing protein [Clostridiales bacterium]|jgi:hypothetical protein|nr:DUF1893 domain-containing protein [Clostridiales bacterium]
MNNDTQKAKTLLEQSSCTCVLCRGEDILTSNLPGISPMMSFINSGLDLDGYSVADRIVGRAAALLFVLAGIREVYAGVMSAGAAAVLQAHGIPYYYDRRVEYIANRAGTGVCPMEAAVMDIDDPAAAHRLLLAKIHELSGS